MVKKLLQEIIIILDMINNKYLTNYYVRSFNTISFVKITVKKIKHTHIYTYMISKTIKLFLIIQNSNFV